MAPITVNLLRPNGDTRKLEGVDDLSSVQDLKIRAGRELEEFKAPIPERISFVLGEQILPSENSISTLLLPRTSGDAPELTLTYIVHPISEKAFKHYTGNITNYSFSVSDLLHDSSEDIQSNRELVLAAVQQDGRALQYASDALRADREVVLAAVREWGYALQYASEELRNDREMVLAAVRRDWQALQYASEELRADRAVVLAAVREWGYALQYASEELRNDREMVLAAVREWGYALQYASEELRNDREMVLAAVGEDGCALEFASKRLQENREVVLAAVQQNGYALQYASAGLGNDREVVLAAMRQNGFALYYASDRLLADQGFIGELKDNGIGSEKLFGCIASYSGLLTIMGLTGASVGGVGLVLGAATGSLAASFVFWVSVALIGPYIAAAKLTVPSLTSYRAQSYEELRIMEEFRIRAQNYEELRIMEEFRIIRSGRIMDALTIMRLMGASIGVGLVLVAATGSTGLAASFFFGVSVALIALGSLLSLVAGSYYLRQRAPAVKKSISDTLNYFGLLRPRGQQAAQGSESSVASFGASL